MLVLGRWWFFGALAFVSGGPVHQRLEGVDVVVDGFVEVAQLCETSRNSLDRERLRVDVVDLVPADRRRDSALRIATDRVGGRDRVVPGVLIEVDEQLLRVAILPPPRGRHVVRRAPLDLPRECEGSPPYVGESVLRLDP